MFVDGYICYRVCCRLYLLSYPLLLLLVFAIISVNNFYRIYCQVCSGYVCYHICYWLCQLPCSVVGYNCWRVAVLLCISTIIIGNICVRVSGWLNQVCLTIICIPRHTLEEVWINMFKGPINRNPEYTNVLGNTKCVSYVVAILWLLFHFLTKSYF